MLTRRHLLMSLVAPTEAAPVLPDARFERGVKVWAPEPGAHRLQGELRPAPERDKPFWGLAQWNTRATIAGAAPERLPSGSIRYSNPAKSIVFGAPQSEDGDLTLALNGQYEYQRRAPEPGTPWPHLLVEAELPAHPNLARTAALPFHLEFQLLYSRPFHAEGWSEKRHTAQFLLYFSVQNRNRQSAGYGDYYWFGVPMYDARYTFPRAHSAKDYTGPKVKGTGKFIFNPPGETYNKRPPADGAWNAIDVDLYPLMREGLDLAWKVGFLTGSHTLEDYAIGGMNCGWEITGPIDAAARIRALGLTAR